MIMLGVDQGWKSKVKK